MASEHAPRNPLSVLFKPKSRAVPRDVKIFLYVRSGGRCEFDGCNRYLIEHHLTKTDGNFAQMAHIWAFSPGGPRGNGGIVDNQALHALSNLILLCPECHKLVDDNPRKYPVEVLKKFKKAHEDRIFVLTDTKPDRHTVAVALKAKVGEHAVAVSLPEMQDAVSPRYFGPRDLVEIDLTVMPDLGTAEYWSVASEAICQQTRMLYEQKFDTGPTRHVSVFALAPIPLLIFLGSRLTNKVPTTLYQRHRDTEDWRWKDDGEVVEYETKVVRRGSDPGCVALALSLSGRVPEIELPDDIDARFTVYEITLVGTEPNPRFLDIEQSLHRFRDEFLRAMRNIVSAHDRLERIHLFPAVPAPIAVAVGRDLMPKRDPALVLYDYVKSAGGFVRTMEVNTK